MDRVELSACLAVDPVSSGNLTPLQLRKIAVYADPKEVDACKCYFPVLQEASRQDNLIQNKVRSASCYRSRSVLMCLPP